MANEAGQPPALDNLSLADKTPASKASAQVITPFDVSGGVDETGKLLPVDYEKLTREFGATRAV
jgi:tryptophanyl-tRNA synthetase